MADAILSEIVIPISKKLGLAALQEFQLAYGVKSESQNLENTISIVKAVLVDAEQQHASSNEVSVWLEILKGVVYDADDLLDDFSTEALKRKLMTQNKRAKKVRIFFSSSNQLVFSLKMGYKVKAIRERLDNIAVDKTKFHFIDRPLEMGVEREKRESHSYVRAENFIGRVDDKKAIVKLLLDNDVKENVSVVTIVGIGGLGKTHLAKLVYNDDEKVAKHFQCKMWVCVSDVFDVKQIAENIIESAIGRKPENLKMEGVQNQLRREIDGKKYFLVLDDVWNENGDLWVELRDLLMGGAKGSKILITTRSKLVADVSGTKLPYLLKGLSSEESWSLFKQLAFKEGKEPEDPRMVKIGKEIAEKCAGVPLAIRVLGSLLYSKTLNEWLIFKNKNIAKIAQEENVILPILRLSYDHLPWYLKQCFAFCHLYPKDHEIDKQQLIQLWMAHGFIQLSDKNQDMENVGDSYFMNLLRKSFFQDEETDEFGNIISCKMHDLMHDLAQLVAGSESSMVGLDAKGVSSRTRHVSFDSPMDINLSWEISGPLLEATKIRTFFRPTAVYMDFEKSVFERIISTFKRLRVLDMHGLSLKMIPNISELKYLRYFDLSYNRMIETLPKSITKLQNLQTLKLSGCVSLRELPSDLRKLVRLRHLEIDGCDGLSDDMPRGMGQLTCLRTLKKFTVDPCNRLRELKDLNNLKGELVIRMKRVRQASNLDIERARLMIKEEAEEANLKGKEYLHSLTLDFFNVDEKEEEELVLEGLRPHENLKKLEIESYGGVRLATWMMSLSSFLPNLVQIQLWKCRGCKHLPKMELLPSLRTLFLHQLTSMEYIDDNNMESSGGGGREPTTTTFFPSLKSLSLWNMPNLKGWWRMSEEESTEEEEEESTKEEEEEPQLLQQLPSFPCLVQSDISFCPKLTSMPLQPTVVKLTLVNVSEKVVQQQMMMAKATPSTSSLSMISSNLEELIIGFINDLVTLPEEVFQRLTSLRKLEFRFCPRLTSLSRGIRHLTALQSLDISDCEKLDLSSDIGDDNGMHFQGLSNLTSLSFSLIPKLESLPAGLQHLTTLQSLSIYNCENLTSLPEWIGNLTSLQHLSIDSCGRLTSLSRGIQRHLTALQSLNICNCEEIDLSDIGDDNGMHFQGLTKLTHLNIHHIPKLESLPAGLQHLTALESLYINGCENLKSIPEWIGNLTSLQYLYIFNCSKVESLPEGMRRLTALHQLSLGCCSQQLKDRCQEETGNDWPKIAHIPYVQI